MSDGTTLGYLKSITMDDALRYIRSVPVSGDGPEDPASMAARFSSVPRNPVFPNALEAAGFAMLSPNPAIRAGGIDSFLISLVNAWENCLGLLKGIEVILPAQLIQMPGAYGPVGGLTEGERLSDIIGPYASIFPAAWRTYDHMVADLSGIALLPYLLVNTVLRSVKTVRRVTSPEFGIATGRSPDRPAFYCRLRTTYEEK